MCADWLIEKVYLVEISAPSDDDGYAIFETMNDRGLPLSPTDMLKSHLLANAGNDDTKKRLNSIWKGRIDELVRIGKEEDSDAIKSWLRARYANSIRAREAGAGPQDYDLIGTEFHRWVRDNGDRLQLTKRHFTKILLNSSNVSLTSMQDGTSIFVLPHNNSTLHAKLYTVMHWQILRCSTQLCSRQSE